MLAMLESGAPTTITSTKTALTTFTYDEEHNKYPMYKRQLYNRTTDGGEVKEHGIWLAVLRSHNIWERLCEEDPDREVAHTKNVWRAIYFQRWPSAGVERPISIIDDENMK